jgi:SAM-dependent methyltransferase
MSTERQPIEDPVYWKKRLNKALYTRQLHHSIFVCTLEKWEAIETRHCQILDRLILPNESILDAGCGYARLLDLMPKDWQGSYVGVDLSPDFIKLAATNHPDNDFICSPLEIALHHLHRIMLAQSGTKYDWCILISIRDMIKRNSGEETWNEIHDGIRKVANRILYLEYDEEDNGVIENLLEG